MFSGRFRFGVDNSRCPVDKKARRMDPHSISMETHHACHRGLSDYHQPSPVNCEDQTLSLEVELKMALPMPNQDEHLPDQIETVVHQAGLEAQR